MKITRSKFEYFTSKHKCNKRMINIGKDKYIYIRSFKGYIGAIYNFIEGVASLPIGIILALGKELWECVMDLPEYFKEMWFRTTDLVPIKYIKVIDDEDMKSME